jgi:hypothetical protein
LGLAVSPWLRRKAVTVKSAKALAMPLTDAQKQRMKLLTIVLAVCAFIGAALKLADVWLRMHWASLARSRGAVQLMAFHSLFLRWNMDNVEKVARAMARADDVDPDQPLSGFRRIVGKTLIVFRYEPDLPAWNYYIPLAKLFIAASAALDRD